MVLVLLVVEAIVEGIEAVGVELWPDTNTDGRSNPKRRRCRMPVQPGILGHITRKYVF